ncbi:MAG: hypothetical protein ACL93V_01700 [Candidatus Electrothrix sp. YB6]
MKSKCTENLWGKTLILIILINNFFYQTEQQINQLYLNVVVLFFLIFPFVLNKFKTINYKAVLAIYGISFFSFVSFVYASDSFHKHRIAFYMFVFIGYILLFLSTKTYKTKDDYILFVYLWGSITIIYGFSVYLSGNRQLYSNVNWIPMTLFYLVALSRFKNIFLSYSLVGMISYFLFISRGTSVSVITALLVMVTVYLKIDQGIIRKLIITAYVLMSFFFFIGIDYYYRYPDLADVYIKTVSRRGLGGRDTALIDGYERLLESNLIGEGIGSAGGVSFEQFREMKSVHIHFGLLELALKMSIACPVIMLIALSRIIIRVKKEWLPGLTGGLMSVFYYNGLAPSHFGLNYLLIILISVSYWDSVESTSGN